MLSQTTVFFAVVFAMLLSFAQIQAEEIPNGIMANYYAHWKRAGTGNAGSTTIVPSTTREPDTTTMSPTVNKQTTTQQQPQSTKPNSPTKDTTPVQQSTKDSTSQEQGSTSVVRTTSVPTSVVIKTTDSQGNTKTTSVSTKSIQTTTQAVKNSAVTGKGTTINAATLTKKTVLSKALVGSNTKKVTRTSFFKQNGKETSSVYVTSVVVPTTTGYAKTTVAPSLADGGGNGGGGLSGSTKAVVGGVVGGIGGAAVLAGIGFVLWRLFAKKKNDGYQAHDEKYNPNRESTMTFGSEGYNSSYGGRVNAASNF